MGVGITNQRHIVGHSGFINHNSETVLAPGKFHLKGPILHRIGFSVSLPASIRWLLLLLLHMPLNIASIYAPQQAKYSYLEGHSVIRNNKYIYFAEKKVLSSLLSLEAWRIPALHLQLGV